MKRPLFVAGLCSALALAFFAFEQIIPGSHKLTLTLAATPLTAGAPNELRITLSPPALWPINPKLSLQLIGSDGLAIRQEIPLKSSGSASVPLAAIDTAQDLQIIASYGNSNSELATSVEAGSAVGFAFDFQNKKPAPEQHMEQPFTIWVVDAYGNPSTALDGTTLSIGVSSACTLRLLSPRVADGGVDAALLYRQETRRCTIEVSSLPRPPQVPTPLLGVDEIDLTKPDEYLSLRAGQQTREATPSAATVNEQVPAAARRAPDIYVLLRQKRYDEAEKLTRARLRERPQEHDLRYLLAQIAKERGDTKGALAEIDTYISLKPDDEQAQFLRADIMLAIDQAFKEQSIAVWQRIASNTKDTQLRDLSLARIQNASFDTASQHSYETDYFSIGYDGDYGSSAERADFQRILTEFATFAYRSIAKDYEHQISAKIPLTIYPPEVYARFERVFHFNTSGFFDGKKVRIRGGIDFSEEVRKTLIHELTHAVIADILRGKATLPLWLNEGLAERQESYVTGMKTLSAEEDRKLREFMQHTTIPFGQFAQDFSVFPPNVVAMLYVQTRAFVFFLEQKIGFSKVVASLRAYGQSRDIAKAIYAGTFRNIGDLEKEFFAGYGVTL